MRLETTSESGEPRTLVLDQGRVRVVQQGRLGGSREVMSRRASDVDIEGDVIVVDGRRFRSVDDSAFAEFVRALVRDASMDDGERRLPPEFTEALGEEVERWQYAVVNVGMFSTSERMANVLGSAGRSGWELVTVFDKSSNWFVSMEKGFMLLRRRVPPGVDVDRWVVEYRG